MPKVKIPMKNKVQGARAMLQRTGQEYANSKKRPLDRKLRDENAELNRNLHEQAQKTAGIYYQNATQNPMGQGAGMMYGTVPYRFMRPEGLENGLIVDDGKSP